MYVIAFIMWMIVPELPRADGWELPGWPSFVIAPLVLWALGKAYSEWMGYANGEGNSR